MKIGFAKREITPPVGTELGGYAGYRPCEGIHDPLWCKVVAWEQQETLYGLVALDLMCVDEVLHQRIAEAVDIPARRLIVCSIHSHAAPQGIFPGEGPLAAVNSSSDPRHPDFSAYLESVVQQTAVAWAEATENREAFQMYTTQGPVPLVGSERHTGADPDGNLTALRFRTESGKVLTVCNFPCHPTVLSAANLQVSADFVSGLEGKLDGDMTVFLNGAAEDISTRFTRREATFEECDRMAAIAAEAVQKLLQGEVYKDPAPLKGIHTRISVPARQVEAPEKAERKLRFLTEQWHQAQERGDDPAAVRIAKSYVEGAGVNLEFARTMGDIREHRLPVTVFRIGQLHFAAVPGEMFSTIRPQNAAVISYANGYYRYLCGEEAYEKNYYEAMAAIVARGVGEQVKQKIEQLLAQL